LLTANAQLGIVTSSPVSIAIDPPISSCRGTDITTEAAVSCASPGSRIGIFVATRTIEVGGGHNVHDGFGLPIVGHIRKVTHTCGESTVTAGSQVDTDTAVNHENDDEPAGLELIKFILEMHLL